MYTCYDYVHRCWKHARQLYRDVSLVYCFRTRLHCYAVELLRCCTITLLHYYYVALLLRGTFYRESMMILNNNVYLHTVRCGCVGSRPGSGCTMEDVWKFSLQSPPGTQTSTSHRQPPQYVLHS